MVGIGVTDLDGRPCGMSGAFLRSTPWLLILLISVSANVAKEFGWMETGHQRRDLWFGFGLQAIWMLDGVVALFHHRRRSAHDLLAATIVVQRGVSAREISERRFANASVSFLSELESADKRSL